MPLHAAVRLPRTGRAAPSPRRLARTPLAVLLLALAACAPGLTPIARPVPGAAPVPAATPARTPSGAGASEAEYLAARQLMVPVAGVAPSQLEDTFSAARDGGERRHNALDILAPRGTPALAADDGTVLRVSRNTLGGLTVYLIDAAQRFVYYYAHLDGYRDGLAAGMPVSRGDVLGFVGTTGNAPPNVPHLHFQAMRYRRDRYWDGEPVNPLRYLVTPAPSVRAVATGDARHEPEESR